MFFRRILERKDSSTASAAPLSGAKNGYNSEDSESVTYLSGTASGAAASEVKDSNNNSSNNTNPSVMKVQRRMEAPIGAVQLTPLWEHVLRTRRLPETISASAIYAEFHERLQDPEWQVRQHALRVLVDVLVVMQNAADEYMEAQQIVALLVRNLGHQAPTVRKGALDCLRVYLAETDVPETVMTRILDSGLTKSDVAGRLSCGVLLSLPALLQSVLHTPRRRGIVQLILERAVQYLDQLTQQELGLKVLSKIKELLGVQEFEDGMNDLASSDALARFYQLCQVYGVTGAPRLNEVKTGAWRAVPREESWRNSASSIKKLDNCPEKGKVIMETEIKINEDTVTMRILEADTETEESGSPVRNFPSDRESAELVCRPLLPTALNHHQHHVAAGIVQVISDSELDEPKGARPQSLSEPSTPSRGLKRVTFGGEIVKMRTPDSDAASSMNNGTKRSSEQTEEAITILAVEKSVPLPSPSPSLSPGPEEAPAVNILSPTSSSTVTSELVLDIPSDNTQPLPPSSSRPFSSQSLRRPSVASSDQSTDSPRKRQEPESAKATISPRSPAFLRSRSTSPSQVSPKIPHKEIEVLHNLQQRDVSPRSLRHEDVEAAMESPPPAQQRKARSASIVSTESPATPKSWEDLDIVTYQTIMDLWSGDWRNRLQGIADLEVSLSSSSNLALVQPYLDSLLRSLLSSERRYEVAELKRELLVNLISRLPLDNLEERTPQILTGLSRQGSAGANRVCKALMQRLPAGTIVAKLTNPDFLHAKSSKFRDHALQMSICALMTFPGTCFDINLLTAQAVYSLLNRKRRVRQSALEVIAVLADISSVKEVLSIVSDTAVGVDQGAQMLEAVRMRLSRLQLPVVTPDSAVIFVFNQADQPGGRRSGADVDWIFQGEGSASPNTIKRRRMRAASRPPGNFQEAADAKDSKEKFRSFSQVSDGLHRHSFHSPPETLDMTSPANDFSQRLSFGARTANGGAASFADRRLVAKACSDTSMEVRSTDSTTTTSSSGSAALSYLHLTARTVGKFSGPGFRFPTMSQHTDFVNNFMRSYPKEEPKISYSNPKPHQQVRKMLQHQNSFTRGSVATQGGEPHRREQRHFELEGHPQASLDPEVFDAISFNPASKAAHPGSKAVIATEVAPTEGSPLSLKSTTYSQKSTASAKSCGSHVNSPRGSNNQAEGRLEMLSLERSPGDAFGELVVDDIEEGEIEPPTQEESLKRQGSVNSLHSKTESIKTQLEDTTPQLSRAQSVKSLPIEEDIEEGSNSFVVVEEVQHELKSTPTKISQEESMAVTEVAHFAPKSGPSSPHLGLQPRSLSLESLYGARPGSKQGSLDTSTTDNTSQSGSQLGNTVAASSYSGPKSGSGNAQNTPLKQKSKSCFMRGRRRVSPVKQAIKMPQPELFPQNMARFEKPRDALLKTFDQLDENNWETNMLGLRSMVRLIRHHAETLDQQMHMFCIQLTRSVRNLRSQVARAACQAAAELFSLKSSTLQQESDDLVGALLHRTADTNRFIRADATRALESMVDHSPPPKILNIITTKGAQHQNALVRTTTAKLLLRLVERLGSERVYAMSRENRDKFFVVGANLLLEGSLETRSYAKSLFRALSDNPHYHRLLFEVIPPRTYRNVEKSLRAITR
ncbi:TOG array regulator of axonemal microtubules protein 1 [Drosophila bipectinata]|uniref:TOG array regulator of axonemal microtubules protein 1 n=1 Tax=Drosophila bipectinata TaxID=42026 RepID=UPI0038B3BF97